jgi:integrase/recombinase XerD
MDAKFEDFIRDRRYLKNVSAKTERWYAQSLNHLINPNPTESDLRDFVVRLRSSGVKAVSVNTYARAINAYLKWSGSSLKIPRLIEPERVLSTFKADDITRVSRWSPKTHNDRRTQLLILMLCDTGCRISELLTLHWSQCDMDNLLITVIGKGDKQRTIPCSYELRRFLHKFRCKVKDTDNLVFGTSTGTAMNPCNAHRAVSLCCKQLGITPPARLLHSLRHLFATTYLRQGGNVFALQRVLGHTSLTMTQRYVSLQTDDLSKQHRSLLSPHSKVKA